MSQTHFYTKLGSGTTFDKLTGEDVMENVVLNDQSIKSNFIFIY